MKPKVCIVSEKWVLLKRMFSDCRSFELGYIGSSTIKYLHYLENNATSVVVLFSDLNPDFFSLLQIQNKISKNVAIIGLTKNYQSFIHKKLGEMGIWDLLSISEISMSMVENILVRLMIDRPFAGSYYSSLAGGNSRSILNYKPTLTPIQEEVLFCLCEGKTGVEIAKKIYRSEAGVRKICEKLRLLFKVRSNQELVVKALRNNWVNNSILYQM